MLRKFNPKKTVHLKQADRLLKIFFHKPKASKAIEWKHVKKILVIDFTGIGDLVMLTPVLRILRKNAPEAELDLVCNPFGKELLGAQGLVDHFFLFSGGKYLSTPCTILANQNKIRKILREIRRSVYDVALEPRGDLRHIFFMNFVRSKRMASYNYTGGEAMLTDVVIPSDKVEHLMEDKLYFIKQLGCRFQEADYYPRLGLPKADLEANLKFLEENGLKESEIIGIHPGASQPNKKWKRYPELMEVLHEEEPQRVFLIFLGSGEEEEESKLRKKAGELKARCLFIQKPLHDYIRLMAACTIVIANDSGAAHIAAAYGLPVVVIFGPFYPSYSRPYARQDIALLSHELPCKPCREKVCRNGTAECIDKITVQEAAESVRLLMRGKDERKETE